MLLEETCSDPKWRNGPLNSVDLLFAKENMMRASVDPGMSKCYAHIGVEQTIWRR